MSQYAKEKSLAWQLSSCEFHSFSLTASERKPEKHQPSKHSQDLCCIRTHEELEEREMAVCAVLCFFSAPCTAPHTTVTLKLT